MRSKPLEATFLYGLYGLFGLTVTLLFGCTRPCAATADCNAGDVCVAAICSAVSCEQPIFATDPTTGACVALSGCFMTEAQRGWQTCQQDPCAGLAETACLSDARCQPAYALPDQQGYSGGSFSVCGGSQSVGAVSFVQNSASDIVAPGANQGNKSKHGGGWASDCTLAASRQYAGCRAVPQIATMDPCRMLTVEQCAARSDCGLDQAGRACQPLHVRTADCDGADAMSCLLNPNCQANGTSCYCPPGATCDCTGGNFIACEKNDHLRRCSSNADCNSGERCDNDEDCITPRTFSMAHSVPMHPGDAGCVGACVPAGCSGMGEVKCNADPSCDGGQYQTVCRLSYYESGNGPSCSLDGTTSTNGVSSCGCGSEFVSCSDQSSLPGLRPERSLLVRDPEIVEDVAFSLGSVLTQLAPSGQVDAFTDSLLTQLGASQTLANGATASARNGITKFYTDYLGKGAGLTQRFTSLFMTTALINRLDLATTSDCGEARLSFAMDTGYGDGNQRLTMIVELKVPDDGNGCKTVAQQWAELSLLDDVTTRRSKLEALYGALLKPEHLGQLRTNEFINPTADEPWELRELHLRPADGMLQLAPVAQTVDPAQLTQPALQAWLSANTAGLQAGTAIIPAQFLAAASTENGGRLDLTGLTTDASLPGLGKALNALTCAGCHLTETKSPFVHIGERLGTPTGQTFRPGGRAVIDEFLQQELPKRGAILQSVLSGTRALAAKNWRPAHLARVH